MTIKVCDRCRKELTDKNTIGMGNDGYIVSVSVMSTGVDGRDNQKCEWCKDCIVKHITTPEPPLPKGGHAGEYR